MKRVFVATARSLEDRRKALRDGLEWIDWAALIPSDARVFVKPNLTTYPVYTPGVTTSPQFIDCLLEILKARTRYITVGESDGGRNAWTADDAFRGHNIPEITERHGAKYVNLSRMAAERVQTMVDRRMVSLELPTILLHETDVFITVPVPKIHCMTTVSLAFKNQWGCLPDTMRLRSHHEFDRKIVAIAKLLPTKIAVFDGRFFLDKNGPLVGGEPVEKNLVIVSDDFGAGSLACCEIMGIPWRRIRHFQVASREAMFPASMAEVHCNRDVAQFRDRTFCLRRTVMNRLALLAFRSKLGTWLIYDSPLDRPVHWVLYRFRTNPVEEFQNQKEALFRRQSSLFKPHNL